MPVELRSGDRIPVWPDAAPGSESWTWREQEMDRNGDRMVRNVTVPTLEVVRPTSVENGTSVIVAPGGAFHYLMIDYEGMDVATWLAARGATAFVLRYRVRRTPEDDAAMGAFAQQLEDHLAATVHGTAASRLGAEADRVRALSEEDGRQAIRVVRSQAAAWGLDPRRVGIVGFSAGGSVAFGASLQFDATSRPDFAAPIYGLPPEDYTVPPDAPPLFLAHAQDDPLIPAAASTDAWLAWTRARRSAELHVFRTGGHGFGMKRLGLASDAWTSLLETWLQGLGLLEGDG